MSHEDCQVAFDLCDSMSQGYLDEEERERAFVDILEPYLGQTIHSDGSIYCNVACGGVRLDVPVYVQVVKAEVGGVSGLPGCRAAGYTACVAETCVSVNVIEQLWEAQTVPHSSTQ